MAMRAAEIAPTRKAESVRVSTYHPRTNDSIWVPMPTKVVEVQTKAKLRYRKTENGLVPRFTVVVSFDNQPLPAALMDQGDLCRGYLISDDLGCPSNANTGHLCCQTWIRHT